jgi:hypothetical protein
MLFVVLALTACGKVRDERNSPDAAARADGATDVASRNDAGAPPAECVAPCLQQLMRDCSAPRMHRCYRDGEGGDAALCDPVTGWSLTPWGGGMEGSGKRLADDGQACLESASGGASPIPGTVYVGSMPGPGVEVYESNGQLVTSCGLDTSSPRYPYAGDAACAGWVTNPMNFECDVIEPGSCPPVTGIFP